MLLRQAEYPGILFRHKHEILRQLPAPTACVADLLTQHQRGLAGAQLFLHAPALDILRQQFGIQTRRFQRYRRLCAQQAHHARVFRRKDFRHQAVFQIQHTNQPSLFEHRHAHDGCAGSDQIRILTERVELFRFTGADLLPGADHRRQHRQRHVRCHRRLFEDPHPHAVGTGPGASLNLRDIIIAHVKQQTTLRTGALKQQRHEVVN